MFINSDLHKPLESPKHNTAANDLDSLLIPF